MYPPPRCRHLAKPSRAWHPFRMGQRSTLRALLIRQSLGHQLSRAVDITPIINATGKPFKFPSQTAADANTLRIPQDLGPFITRGTITQAMLDDPNSLLRDLVTKQNVISTTTLFISTAPPPPVGLFGGGTDNIAFLLGQAAATRPTLRPRR